MTGFDRRILPDTRWRASFKHSLSVTVFAFAFDFKTCYWRRSHLVGFIYPAYASFKAIEAQGGSTASVKHDEAQWCVGRPCAQLIRIGLYMYMRTG